MITGLEVMVSLYVHMNVIFLLWYYDILLISIVAVQFGLVSTLVNTDRTQGPSLLLLK